MCPICDSEFVDDVAHVIAHSTNADPERRADLPISLTMSRPVENFAFAWSECHCGKALLGDRLLVTSSEQNVSVHHGAVPIRGFGVPGNTIKAIKNIAW